VKLDREPDSPAAEHINPEHLSRLLLKHKNAAIGFSN
jgi:hypothetical protein